MTRFADSVLQKGAAAIAILAGFSVLGCEAENIILGEEPRDVAEEDTGNDDAGDTPDIPDTRPDVVDVPDTTIPDVTDNTKCNLTGTWVAQVYTISAPDIALGGRAACATNHYYVEVDQPEGSDDFTVTRGASCDYRVDGVTTVLLYEETRRALLRHSEDSLIDLLSPTVSGQGNSQTGRGGRYFAENGKCMFELDRWWLARGLDLDEALPPVAQYGTLEDTRSYSGGAVVVDNSENGGTLNFAEDWDPSIGSPGNNTNVDNTDGIILDTNVSGASGSRHVVQRDWTEATVTEAVPHSLGGFVALIDFRNSEGVVASLGTNGQNNPLLATRSSAALRSSAYSHFVTFVPLAQSMPTTTEDAMFSYCENTVVPAIGPPPADSFDPETNCCVFPYLENTVSKGENPDVPDSCPPR